jgi:cysteinyl-tRNA synthetase
VLRLTDTRTRRPEEIRPSAGGPLRVYACGPTVYRHAHVGNLRTYLLTDLVTRVAETLHGWQVHLVQNITDVGHLQDDASIDPTGEDKLLAAARREGRGPLEIARHYEEQFHRDLDALNIRPAAAYPRASESIELMVELVERLVRQGNAYQGPDGSVFFDARSFPGYGELSGNRLEDLRPGHRADPDALARGKRFHADWALWKTAGAQRQLIWPSPWGTGFPGWHVECSAMSLHHLGDSIDLHLGGIDLRFPHHEDERAQSDAAVGHEVVHHWLHGEHLLAHGRKMAKSTGNEVLLTDLLERGRDPLALRLFVLTGRYRQQMNLTWDALDAADRRLARWRSRVAEWAEQPSRAMCADYVGQLHEALDDDLDTPSALVVLGRLERDPALPPGAKFEMFAHADQVLGLDLVRFVGRPQHGRPLPTGASELLQARADARGRRDFAASDRLRAELAGMGVRVTDAPDGQRWSVQPVD